MNQSPDPLDVAVIAFGSQLRVDILRVLTRTPGASAQEIAEELGVLRQTLGVNLRALEAANLITSSDTSEARRGRRLRFTVNQAAYLDTLESIRHMIQA